MEEEITPRYRSTPKESTKKFTAISIIIRKTSNIKKKTQTTFGSTDRNSSRFISDIKKNSTQNKEDDGKKINSDWYRTKRNKIL